MYHTSFAIVCHATPVVESHRCSICSRLNAQVTSPRINHGLLSKYVGQQVTIVGQVIGVNGDNANIKASV
jgi:hypothetical protein